MPTQLSTVPAVLDRISVEFADHEALVTDDRTLTYSALKSEVTQAAAAIIDLGVKAGVVEKSGSWFSYDSQRIGQGRENAKTFLRNNPDMANKIEAAVRANSGLIAEKILAGEKEDEDDEAAEG